MIFFTQCQRWNCTAFSALFTFFLRLNIFDFTLQNFCTAKVTAINWREIHTTKSKRSNLLQTNIIPIKTLRFYSRIVNYREKNVSLLPFLYLKFTAIFSCDSLSSWAHITSPFPLRQLFSLAHICSAFQLLIVKKKCNKESVYRENETALFLMNKIF